MNVGHSTKDPLVESFGGDAKALKGIVKDLGVEIDPTKCHVEKDGDHILITGDSKTGSFSIEKFAGDGSYNVRTTTDTKINGKDVTMERGVELYPTGEIKVLDFERIKGKGIDFYEGVEARRAGRGRLKVDNSIQATNIDPKTYVQATSHAEAVAKKDFASGQKFGRQLFNRHTRP
jgi:hypothetical protein